MSRLIKRVTTTTVVEELFEENNEVLADNVGKGLGILDRIVSNIYHELEFNLHLTDAEKLRYVDKLQQVLRLRREYKNNISLYRNEEVDTYSALDVEEFYTKNNSGDKYCTKALEQELLEFNNRHHLNLNKDCLSKLTGKTEPYATVQSNTPKKENKEVVKERNHDAEQQNYEMDYSTLDVDQKYSDYIKEVTSHKQKPTVVQRRNVKYVYMDDEKGRGTLYEKTQGGRLNVIYDTCKYATAVRYVREQEESMRVVTNNREMYLSFLNVSMQLIKMSGNKKEVEIKNNNLRQG